RIGSGASRAAPLAIVAGGLILDLGEAERTFIYRCQDRFLAYTGLWQLPSVFFTAGDAHVEIYRAQIAEQSRRFDLIRRRTNLLADAQLRDPLYVGCDIDEMRLFACSAFEEAVARLGPVGGFAVNQISPSYASLLGQLGALLRRHGLDIDAGDSGRRMGA